MAGVELMKQLSQLAVDPDLTAFVLEAVQGRSVESEAHADRVNVFAAHAHAAFFVRRYQIDVAVRPQRAQAVRAVHSDWSWDLKTANTTVFLRVNGHLVRKHRAELLGLAREAITWRAGGKQRTGPASFTQTSTPPATCPRGCVKAANGSCLCD